MTIHACPLPHRRYFQTICVVILSGSTRSRVSDDDPRLSITTQNILSSNLCGNFIQINAFTRLRLPPMPCRLPHRMHLSSICVANQSRLTHSRVSDDVPHLSITTQKILSNNLCGNFLRIDAFTHLRWSLCQSDYLQNHTSCQSWR